MSYSLKINFYNEQTIYCPGQILTGERLKEFYWSVKTYKRFPGNVIIDISEKCQFSGKSIE